MSIQENDKVAGSSISTHNSSTNEPKSFIYSW